MKKVRLKYTISFSLLIIATFFNWTEISIQETYVDIVKWVTLGVLGGFSVKTVVKAFLSKNTESYNTMEEE